MTEVLNDGSWATPLDLLLAKMGFSLEKKTVFVLESRELFTFSRADLPLAVDVSVRRDGVMSEWMAGVAVRNPGGQSMPLVAMSKCMMVPEFFESFLEERMEEVQQYHRERAIGINKKMN